SVGTSRLRPSGGSWTVYVAGTSRWLTTSPASAPRSGSGGSVGPGVVEPGPKPGGNVPGAPPPLGSVDPGPVATDCLPESVTFKSAVVRPNPVTIATTTTQTMSTAHWRRSRPGGRPTGSGSGAGSTRGSGAIVSRSGSA